MATQLKHLCFDKDGVLIDVHEYWRHTTEIRAKFIKEKLLLNHDDELKLIDLMGIDLKTGKIKKSGPIGYHPRSVIINRLEKLIYKRSPKTDRNQIEKYFLTIDQLQQKSGDFQLKLLKGVEEFLYKNRNKYIMTIFTSDRRKNAEYALSKLGIIKYFKLILGGDSVNKPKPNPEGIRIACKSVNIKNNYSAYISDTNSDLIMAREAQLMLNIGVLSGLGKKEDLAMVADLIFKDFNMMSEYLNANR